VTLKNKDATDETPDVRITLNYGMLNKADNVFVVATGEVKRSIVSRLKEVPSEDRPKLPVDLLNKTVTTFYIDNDAWKPHE